MNDKVSYKINTGVINTGNIINSTVTGSVFYGNVNWENLKDEINTLSTKYKEHYNNTEDLLFINNIEKAVENKDKDKLKSIMSKTPIMLKAFIKELGLSLLIEFLVGKII